MEKDFNGLWRVVEIRQSSPADIDDVRLNDVVLTVNGRNMKGLSEWDIKQLFGTPDTRSVSLELQSASGGPVRAVTLARKLRKPD
mmetsp:Transcript_29127/g.76416  ORF Transcript_29127/g.76416 Transcript_29127/m.76416 type:complete len:85 (+) Transcript_29127:400-654(+)|eukprot:CAMPEP_0113706088 /NCGR_PEP_ID=MMETSP0038_2-20120614/27517_1 /TAXON_ID=2898 /ORGANISM="Cryptomonas paramecium" /LENGTH=84 /DNA_ID=CAMNT_0000631215 /DNA_START=443 /DNA_END=697 /DNA_ORIENTATION=- /assembly_acc=CAM_ASM_000170